MSLSALYCIYSCTAEHGKKTNEQKKRAAMLTYPSLGEGVNKESTVSLSEEQSFYIHNS